MVLRKLNDKLLLELKNVVLNYESSANFAKRHRICGTTVYEGILRLVDRGEITPEQRRDYALQRYAAGNQKITKEKTREICIDVFSNHLTKQEVVKKYHIAGSTFSRTLDRGVEYDFITIEELNTYRSTAYIRGREKAILTLGTKVLEEMRGKNQGYAINTEHIDALVNKLGQEELTRRFHKGRDDWIDKHPVEMQKNAREGGRARSKMSDSAENLNNGTSYGKNPCYLTVGEESNERSISFQSSGERLTAAFLLEFGLLEDIIEGENYQKRFSEERKFKTDFYIAKKNLVIEFHPLPKNHSGIREYTEKGYLKKRKSELKDCFDGDIVVITNPRAIEFYYKRQEFGLNLSWAKFRKKFKVIEDRLKTEDEALDFDYKMETLQSQINSEDGSSEFHTIEEPAF